MARTGSIAIKVILPLACALLALSWNHPTRAQPPPGIELIPPAFVVNFGKSESIPFDLVIKNNGPTAAEFDVILHKLVHATNGRLAQMTFGALDDKRAEIKSPGRLKAKLPSEHELRVGVRATGVVSHGLYRGTIEVIDPASGRQLARKEVEARKEKRSLNLSLTGHTSGQPKTLAPKHPQDKKFRLIVKNAGDALLRLEIEPVVLTGPGQQIAAKAIPSFTLEADQQQVLELALEDDAVLPTSGILTGTLVFKEQSAGGKNVAPLRRIFELALKPLSLNLTIDKADPNKPVEFTATGPDRKTFEIRLKKAAEDPVLTITAQGTVQLPDGKTGTLSSAESLVLEDGNWHALALTFDLEAMPASGVHQGLLTISDAENQKLRQRVTFALKGDYAADGPVVVLIIAIALGSVLSYVLYIFLPRSIRRIRLRQELKAIKGQMNDLAHHDLSHAGQATLSLQNRLEVDRSRLRSALEVASTWSPSFADRMAEIEALLKDLTAGIDRLQSVGLLRKRIWTEASIPFSLRDRFEAELRRAEWRLVVGDPEGAETQLNALQLRLAGDEFRKAHGTELSKKIAERLGQPDATNPPSAIDWINLLIKELRSLGAAEPIGEDRIEEVGRKFAVVESYLNDYATLIHSDQHIPAEEESRIFELLKGGLESGVQIREARNRIHVLQTGVSLVDIVDHFEGAKGRVDLSSKTPSPGDLIWARYQFSDPQVEAEIELMSGLEFLWDFGDGTRETKGKSCVHYFPESAAGRFFEVRLRVRDPNGSYLSNEVVESITLRKKSGRPLDSSVLEAAGFLLALGLAVLVGIETQFKALVAAPQEPESLFELIKAYLPAFLWGFALDQAKGSFISAFTKLKGSEGDSAAGAGR